MKAKLLIFMLVVTGCFFCLPGFAGALDNWHWRNPLPNGNPQTGPHTLYGLAFGKGIFIGVGDSGTASISSDVTNWTEISTATTSRLLGIIYANGLFLAVGNGGAVETSTDGTNWVLRASGTTSSLARAAYANGKFVAAGDSIVITSSDAVNWSPAVSGITGAPGLTGGSSGFVAITGYSQVSYSSNGTAWTSQTLTAPGSGFNGAPLINRLITYANGAYLIVSTRFATSASADRFVFRSTNGISWTTNVVGNVYTGPYYFSYNFFMVGDGVVIATGQQGGPPFFMFSNDGINWTTTNNLPDIYQPDTAGIYGNGSYVIVGPALFAYNLPPILTSTDALNWTNRQHLPYPPTGNTNGFTSIASGSGIYIVAASNSIVRSTDGLVYTNVGSSPVLSLVIPITNGFIGVGSAGKIYQASDGLSWTQRNSGTANNLHGVTLGNGLLVAVGDNGAIQTSPTGTIWTSRTSGTSLALFSVAYSNGLFVTVGQLGTVLTSPDGVSWTGQDSGQLTNLLSVTYGSAGFTAVGPGGTILTSPDGVTWTRQNSGTLASFESIAFGNGYYLAVGDNAVAMTSPDGVNWTSRNVGVTGGQNFLGAAFLNGRFDIVGTGGTIIESDPLSPLFDLQIRRGAAKNMFSVFSGPGSVFRIQVCTNLAGSNWTDVATISNASPITLWTNATTGFNQRYYRAVSP